jgi:N-methylhydantoinase A/acetone carboxylase, beta subunit
MHIAKLLGEENVITLDIGGTSADISLIEGGEPSFTTEGKLAGFPIRVPMMEIHTIGAGGGSIGWIDAGGSLRIGPRSAGADPGPACYKMGEMSQRSQMPTSYWDTSIQNISPVVSYRYFKIWRFLLLREVYRGL